MMSPLDPETLASLHIDDLLHEAENRAQAWEARSAATRWWLRPPREAGDCQCGRPGEPSAGR